MPRPGIVGMRGSMVLRLRLCMISSASPLRSTPSPPPGTNFRPGFPRNMPGRGTHKESGVSRFCSSRSLCSLIGCRIQYALPTVENPSFANRPRGCAILSPSVVVSCGILSSCEELRLKPRHAPSTTVGMPLKITFLPRTSPECTARLSFTATTKLSRYDAPLKEDLPFPRPFSLLTPPPPNCPRSFQILSYNTTKGAAFFPPSPGFGGDDGIARSRGTRGRPDRAFGAGGEVVPGTAAP